MRLGIVCFLIAVSALACKDDAATAPSTPQAHIDLPGAVLRGTLDEQRAAAGISGGRSSTSPVMAGATTTLLDSSTSSSAAMRTSSESFVMVSTLRMEVQ
jgi:hypothetical protein